MTPYLILATILIPWAGALLVWLAGDVRPRLQHSLAVLFAVLNAAGALWLIPQASEKLVIDLPVGAAFGSLTFRADALAVWLTAIAAVVGSLAVIFSIDYMRGEKSLGRYYALVLLFIGSMAGLVLTSNLLYLFLFWEMTALCSYGLISFYNDDPAAVKGGLKALVITQIGGVGLLGLAMATYATLGTLEMQDLLANSGQIPAHVLAWMGIGVLAAAAAKSAQFPFHGWLPDAMEAPTPVSALIHAATMVNAGVYLLVRLSPAFEAVEGWSMAVMATGLITALIGAILGCLAWDLKRILAYSTISQLGYMVYAIGVGGAFAAQFHLLSHALFKALLFLGAGAVIHAVGTRDIRKMGGLGKEMTFTRIVFVIGALALAGLPPLNGFWSKELILESGLAGGPVWSFILMLIGAAITAFYTARMLMLVFWGKPADSHRHVHDAGLAMKLSLGLLAAGTLLSGLLGGWLNDMMVETLPFHHLHHLSLLELGEEILLAPATWLALLVILSGAAVYYAVAGSELRFPQNDLREKMQGWLSLDGLNTWVVNNVQGGGASLQSIHTGQLNWNILAVIGGLILVLIFLAGGAQ